MFTSNLKGCLKFIKMFDLRKYISNSFRPNSRVMITSSLKGMIVVCSLLYKAKDYTFTLLAIQLYRHIVLQCSYKLQPCLSVTHKKVLKAAN